MARKPPMARRFMGEYTYVMGKDLKQHTITVFINVDEIARALVAKAVKTKGGRVTRIGGAILVKRETTI